MQRDFRSANVINVPRWFGPDHGVAFPVAYAALLIDNPRAFVNADPVLDRAPALLTTRVTLPAWFLAAQVLPQVATSAFVFINVHVDRLMADSQSAFQCKSARCLFRAHIQPNQSFNFRPFQQ